MVRGFVVAYNRTTSLHEVEYEDEDEHCHFKLMEDLLAGDLKFMVHTHVPCYSFYIKKED